MNSDVVFRTLAVVAAIALLAAPYWRVIARGLAAATEAAREHGAAIGRLAAAALIVAAAWGVVPLPEITPVVPTVEVEEPSAEMRTIVADVGKELAGFGLGDRVVWAATWNKAAVVVAGDKSAKIAALTNTRSLREFTALAMDIAWRRVGGNRPGNKPLRLALEQAYSEALGDEVVAVDDDIRSRYVEFSKAVAWAGLAGE